MAYQPALDGLRALAVLGVLLYHAGVSWAPGGFLGVDAFFVLSGFLITSLLVDEWRTRGRIDFGAFWARRARRLLPALLLVVIAVGAYAVFVARPDELERIRGDELGSLLYVANWRQLFESSYFAKLATPSPLLHTWSLGIEEQWYLVWPLALVLMLRVTAGRRCSEVVSSRKARAPKPTVAASQTAARPQWPLEMSFASSLLTKSTQA